jgi:hypothetical protein
MQVQDLITNSLAVILAVPAGATAAAEDLAIGQTFLNDLIGSYNAAAKKSLAGVLAAYNESLAADLTKCQAVLTGYDPTLFTFTAPPTAPVLTFVPVAVTVNLTDTLTLPNGWPRALKFDLAIDLTDVFGKPLTQTLMARAQQARAEIITPANNPAPTS